MISRSVFMISKSDLYFNKVDCCGCELCSIICPKNVISMFPDEEGFLYPSIVHQENCIDCKKCIKICPEKNPSYFPQKLLVSFGGFSKLEEDVRNSSSGGFAYNVSKNFIRQGGVVYGVCYANDFMSVCYERAESVEDLDKFRTSKYCQASKNQVYRQVKLDLMQGHKVLFVGLPCEVYALYGYIGSCTQDLYTICLICHGPTSLKVHEDFCRDLIMKEGSQLKSFSVRHKEKGWKPYYIKAEFLNGHSYLKQFTFSNYDIAFQYLKRPSCSNCKFKLYNKGYGVHSDLIIGDFHMAHEGMPHYNPWGSSQVSAMTEKGINILKDLSDDFFLFPISELHATIPNEAIIKSIPQKKYRRLFSQNLQKRGLYSACNAFPIKYDKFKTRFVKALKDILRPTYKKLKNVLRFLHESF